MSSLPSWAGIWRWGPLHRVDPYPFPFLLFLDNVVQLVLCSVILVGPGDADFTTGDRDILQPPMMASGVLVALAEAWSTPRRSSR